MQDNSITDQIPQSLNKRPDLLKQILGFARNQFNTDDDSKVTIKDVSGMSNPVFIVGFKDNKESNIIIRFFESNVADFQLEQKIFQCAGEKGYTPLIIDSDSKTYRIETFYTGVPLLYDQLMRKDVIEAIMPEVCKFNNENDLKKLVEDQKEMTSIELINSKEGWYNIVKDQVFPLIDEIKAKLTGVELDKNAQQCFDSINDIWSVFYEDEGAFKKEYLELLPQITEETRHMLVSFSHNDCQENNIMVKWDDNETCKYLRDVVLIDFENSKLNYRGVDLASYIIESTIDYQTEEDFVYHEENIPDFNSNDEENPINVMISVYLQTYMKIVGKQEDNRFYEKEFPIFKEQVKKLVLHMHLYWVSWGLLMSMPLIAKLFEGGQITNDTDLILQTVTEMNEFLITYSKFRLDLYFKWRQLFYPESPSALKNKLASSNGQDPIEIMEIIKNKNATDKALSVFESSISAGADYSPSKFSSDILQDKANIPLTSLQQIDRELSEASEQSENQFEITSMELLDIGIQYGDKTLGSVKSLPLFKKVNNYIDLDDKFELVMNHGKNLFTYLDDKFRPIIQHVFFLYNSATGVVTSYIKVLTDKQDQVTTYVNETYTMVNVRVSDNWMRMDFDHDGSVSVDDLKQSMVGLYDFLKDFNMIESASSIKSKIYTDAIAYMQKDLDLQEQVRNKKIALQNADKQKTRDQSRPEDIDKLN